jgi:hypothetical protein
VGKAHDAVPTYRQGQILMGRWGWLILGLAVALKIFVVVQSEL